MTDDEIIEVWKSEWRKEPRAWDGRLLLRFAREVESLAIKEYTDRLAGQLEQHFGKAQRSAEGGGCDD